MEGVTEFRRASQLRILVRRKRDEMTTALLLSVLLMAAPAAPADQAKEPSQPEVQANDSNVRMRKLHLVRPELLPYPMAYEVYC